LFFEGKIGVELDEAGAEGGLLLLDLIVKRARSNGVSPFLRYRIPCRVNELIFPSSPITFTIAVEALLVL
jgi:hypothetical protein